MKSRGGLAPATVPISSLVLSVCCYAWSCHAGGLAVAAEYRDRFTVYVVTAHYQAIFGAVTPAQTTGIAGLIQAAALPRDRLEHLYVEESSHDIYIVLFVVAPDLDSAERNAAVLCERALAGVLGDYLIIDCAVRLNAPLADVLFQRDP